ncbi:MAG: hypothetical protein K2P59_06020 [Acetatifactor sp.]|nr:hypothetical protein [Acetatifactor sp.]
MGEKINMDNGWKFLWGDLPPKSSADGWGGAKARAFSFGAVSETFDDSRYFAGGSLEGGIVWYRKRFAVPKD